MSTQASRHPNNYQAVADHENDVENAPLLTHEHSTNWNTQRKTMTILTGAGAALQAAFVIVSAWMLSYSFYSCNRYLNGLFMVFMIISLSSLGMSILRAATGSIPAQSSHLTATAFCGLKMLFLIFFVLVAYQPEEACNETIDKTARIIAPMALFSNIYNMAIMEYGFSVSSW